MLSALVDRDTRYETWKINKHFTHCTELRATNILQAPVIERDRKSLYAVRKEKLRKLDFFTVFLRTSSFHPQLG